MSRLPFILMGIVAVAGPADAARQDERSALSQYVRARAADVAGLTHAAAAGYAAALATSPGDEVLATRAYRQAMTAGDRALALRTARMLDAKDVLPPDGLLLLVAEAIGAGDWPGATRAIDRVEKQAIYEFAVPVLRAWVAFGAKQGDPLSRLADTRRAGSIAAAYAAEHRALLLLATGQTDDGIAAVRSLAGTNSGRGLRLRLAAAAQLAKSGDRQRALTFLSGDDAVLTAARRRVEAGKPLPAPIDTAAAGIAELFARIAVDINRERVTPIALTLARLATFLAPGNAETWLVTSALLASAERYDAALAVLAQISPDDPFAEAGRFQRVQLLVRKGEQGTALTEALAAANRPGAGIGDWTRVGELYADLDRHADAAAAYGKALAMSEAMGEDGSRWTLLLLRGAALDEAGDWPGAKAALEKAAKLAPDQAVVLNYLGYAQLERRENLAEAEKLIEQASRLRPDDAAITDSLGWTYYIRGNIPKAIETLERAVAGEPGEPTINEHLGDAYWTAGRKYEARYAWRAALVYAEEKDAARISRKLDHGLSRDVAAP